jgi:hypothetical protein
VCVVCYSPLNAGVFTYWCSTRSGRLEGFVGKARQCLRSSLGGIEVLIEGAPAGIAMIAGRWGVDASAPAAASGCVVRRVEGSRAAHIGGRGLQCLAALQTASDAGAR